MHPADHSWYLFQRSVRDIDSNGSLQLPARIGRDKRVSRSRIPLLALHTKRVRPCAGVVRVSHDRSKHIDRKAPLQVSTGKNAEVLCYSRSVPQDGVGVFTSPESELPTISPRS